MAKQDTQLMDTIISFCKRRGFIFPGSEIYGGLANAWDYGPLGVELKNNIRQEWWKQFVHQRSDMVGLDAALIMNPKVWEASGHIREFSDPLVECKNCHERFRADQTDGLEYVKTSEELGMTGQSLKILPNTNCPKCKIAWVIEKTLEPPRMFNMMFKTNLGPIADEKSIVFLRPETAQAMFVNFKNILDSSRVKLSFGIAQTGKAFRNEITPGNFIFRTREFEQMEIEYFVREAEWQQWFEYWLAQMREWLKHLGVKQWHETEIPDGERAHYSKRTIDIEYDYPFGQKELYGLAYRGDFDLKNHSEKSNQDLRYTDPVTQEQFLPHVIEPTFGLDRSVLVALLEAYHEEQAPTAEEGESATRVVMKFPKWLAPVKVAVLPLVKNNPEVVAKAKEVYDILKKDFVCQYDESGSIGKRYRRQDEIGTPYCVTIDFDTLKRSQKVTVRDRDTMAQETVKIKDVRKFLAEKIYAPLEV